MSYTNTHRGELLLFKFSKRRERSQGGERGEECWGSSGKGYSDLKAWGERQRTAEYGSIRRKELKDSPFIP